MTDLNEFTRPDLRIATGGGPMNILVVAVEFPFPVRSGVTMRVSALVRQLAMRHAVTLLTFATAEDRDAVATARGREGIEIEVVDRQAPPEWVKRAAQLRSLASPRPYASSEIATVALQRAIDAVCARRHFDVIQLEGSLLSGLRYPAGPRIVLDEHNIEYEVLQRMREGERSLLRRTFNGIEQRRFRRFEQSAWTRAHGCAVTSGREAPVVLATAPSVAVQVVPNGVDVERFAPAKDAVQPRTVMFNGTLEYRPNVDAARHLVDDIWPLVRRRHPDAELMIVGRAPAAEARRLAADGVTVTGQVPDVRALLARAAVAAVPVRIGGGTRLKVVEALAMGKAIVSTSLGCEGIDVLDGTHLRIADDAGSFADRIAELFDGPESAAALGVAGRRLAETQYTWDLAGERLEALYRRVTATAPTLA